MGNIVSLIGRPNVGKSTLFNRLIRSREAIVDAVAGVTRDRHYGKSDWNGYEFSVIDTGGYVVGSGDVFESEIRKQAALAIDESDVIILMVDGREGLTPPDQEIADILRRSEKPCYIAVNKIDSPANYLDYAEFYALGLPDIFPISAISGSGTGELLDAVVKHFSKTIPATPTDLPKIAVVGKPNVGKSSIINTFIGRDRHIVTPLAGTTRDTIYTRYNSFGFDFYLIDTAGMRKKRKIEENIEFYSVMRAVRSIENADVCIVMADASQGFDAQDLNIFWLAARNHKGIVLVINKWDLVEKDNHIFDDFTRYVKKRIAPFNDVPIIFTSVPEKQRIYKVIETAVQVYRNRNFRIPTPELNDYLLPVIREMPPPMNKDKMIRIKYVTQLPVAYPAFAFFCNLPQYVVDSYRRFLENRIRQQWNFSGVPIEIYFRRK